MTRICLKNSQIELASLVSCRKLPPNSVLLKSIEPQQTWWFVFDSFANCIPNALMNSYRFYEKGKWMNSAPTGAGQRGKWENQVGYKGTRACRRESISQFKGSYYSDLTECCHEEMWGPELPEELKNMIFSFFFFSVLLLFCEIFLFLNTILP